MKNTITGLFAGSIRYLEPEGQRTGIFKEPIKNAQVLKEGIVGDIQADRRFHGGPEKALHQYSCNSYDLMVSHYPELNEVAVPGSMGENISSNFLSESNVCIGDSYRMGGVMVQVSQPRTPCWKINHKFGIDQLSMFIESHQITGWYYRVIDTGVISVNDQIELVERPNEEVTIEKFLHITRQHRPELEELAKIISCEGLNEDWRNRLESRLEYLASVKEL